MTAQKGNIGYKNALAMLDEYLRSQSLRMTTERQIVLNELCQLAQPFTAEQLVEACRSERISQATIYNTLRLFLAAHILHTHERQRGRAATEYELMTGNVLRMQMVCHKCGRVNDFHDRAIERLIRERKYWNFSPEQFSLFVYGECKICHKRRNKNKQK